ncbi:MAG: hypothetical protein FD127_1777 [Acidimicrobiaceae bacterium]|nr:MAG: hypothetical protein FD127_1777 [Acidimicrobiaceae bacterium]
MALADVAVQAGRGWGALAMNDSSSALREPTLAARFQTLATSQFASDRSTNEILHTDVVLAGPNPQSLDQRAGQLRGQRVDWFVSFDTRARHIARIRPPEAACFTRTTRRHTGLLVCPSRENRVRQR